MKKWLIFFSLFAFLIMVSFGIYVYICRSEVISTILSKTLKTQVRVETLDFAKDGVHVRKFYIMNPSECSLRKAFSVEKVDILMKWNDLVASIIGLNKAGIVIDTVDISHPYISLEIFNLTGSDNNWKRILNNLPSSESSSKNTQEKTSTGSRTFSVRQIILTNIHIEAKNHALAQATLKVPTIKKITITRKSTDAPMTTEELISLTIDTVLAQIGHEMNMKDLTKDIKNFQNFLETHYDQSEDAATNIKNWMEENSKKAKDAFNELFNSSESK